LKRFSKKSKDSLSLATTVGKQITTFGLIFKFRVPYFRMPSACQAAIYVYVHQIRECLIREIRVNIRFGGLASVELDKKHA
jgi:hypothetical protein